MMKWDWTQENPKSQAICIFYLWSFAQASLAMPTN